MSCTCPHPTRFAEDCPRHGVQHSKPGDKITLRNTACWVDGARIEVESGGGWLRVAVTADESIIGYAVTVNGRDLPYVPEANRG